MSLPLKNKLQTLYRRYERLVPPASFIGGFLYDTYALKRIDQWFDNLQLLAYLLISGVAIVLIGRVERGHTKRPLFTDHLEWFVIALHFCMGSLFSAYTIFYFRSAAVDQAYIFVGLLLVILIMNELVRRRLSKLKLLGVLHFFCGFAFFTFFLPIMTRSMGFFTFLTGGLISLGLTLLVWQAVFAGHMQDMWREKNTVIGPQVGLLFLMIFLYAMNWIPPVPLSVSEIGIYRSVKKLKDGQYEVRYRKPTRWEPIRRDDRKFEYTVGDPIYCFTSIFAPTAMKQRVFHRWQWKNKQGEWVTTDKIGYSLVGGRDGGWRGYTMKQMVGPGAWRIDVETEDGRIIGRIPLTIQLVHKAPKEMEIEVK